MVTRCQDHEICRHDGAVLEPQPLGDELIGVIPVLLLVSFVLYGLMWLAPGDAAALLVPEDATPDEVALVRERWGLDRSVFEQYGLFLLIVVILFFSYPIQVFISSVLGFFLRFTL